MKKSITILLAILLPLTAAAVSLRRVSVHDPSIVWDGTQGRYYIFGSHRGAAYTTDLMTWSSVKAPWKTATSSNASNASAFTTPEVTTFKKGDQTYEFNFNAKAWAEKGSTRKGNTYSVDGMMWAPDVIWNPKMNKWCMYLSINGDYWYSSIILLTADRIAGPYRYQGPVVISGFFENNTYKETDLELAIGTQTALPARYKLKDDGSGNWGERYPNCIDPCVFFDEDGKLWMTYGSWSGGIWMLELDEETGLRDYDVTYSLTGSGNGITVDPYFGKKIAGGHYVSGEGSYIEYIGGYYFLFMSYGFFDSTGGYQMRVFRSQKPDGPYVDTNNTNALFTSYKMNYGPNSDNRGVNIFGAYGDWGYQTVSGLEERSQGHNSVIAAEDGRTYLVYHTRFQNYPNNAEAHQVRVHQLFQNVDGWLVAAPFEYTGEQVKSEDIATTQQIATEQIPGTYQLLTHTYGLNQKNKAFNKPVEIQLNADGTISGSRTGTWSITKGTSYITIKISTTEYKGVMVEQTLEKFTPSNLERATATEKAAAFTVLNKNGVTMWGYKSESAGYTAIDNVKADAKTSSSPSYRKGTYDMQGRRVNTPQQKGVYVKDGRKIIVK